MKQKRQAARAGNVIVMGSRSKVAEILSHRFGRIFVLSVPAVLAMAVGLSSLLETIGVVETPPALERLTEKLPIAFPLHMGFSALALIAIVLTLATRRRPGLHRPLGRFALLCVLIGSITAFPSAALSGADPVARIGFAFQGLVWLAFAAIGFAAVRARRLALHRAAMALMAATAFGAVVLRLVLAALVWLGEDTSIWYGGAAWAAWLLPIAIVAAALAVGKRAPLAHKGRSLLPLPGQ